MTPKNNIRIAVIGAGKIAYSITRALINGGYSISIIVSRNINSAKSLALKNKIRTYSSELKDIPASCNFFILSVPDNQIKITAEKLSKLKLNFKDSIFIHLSGAITVSVLRSLKNKKSQTASLHIMQSFPSREIIDIKNCYAAIETENPDAEKTLIRMAERLGLKPFQLQSNNKAFYHMAGVYSSNFLVGLFYNANKMMNKAKIKDYDFFTIMEPIILSTLNNIKKEGTSKALSGPVERGDIHTIKEHILKLKNELKKNNKEYNNYYLLQNYIIHSLHLIEVVQGKKGNLSDEHKKLKTFLLKEALKSFGIK